jgi:glycosyltransferase involved in cell wall biosynthesis
VDVIHLHYPFFGGAETVAWFKARHSQIPLVISYHMDALGSGWLKWVFAVYGKTACPWILGKADRITVSSLDYAQHSALLAGRHLKKVRELPFGVDQRFQPGPGFTPAAPFRVLFVAVAALDRAHYFKGLEVLLQAFARLLTIYRGKREIKLIIAGDGELRPYYERLAQKQNIGEVVEFLGGLSDAALIAQYQRASVTVKPSTDTSESLGMTSLESLACGTPVIVSDLPGMRTVIDARTGMIVPPGNVAALADAIASLLARPDDLPAMRQHAANRANRLYRWDKAIEKLEMIYSEVLRDAL